MRILISLLLAVMVSLTPAIAEDKDGRRPRVILETSKGTVLLELFSAKAPETVRNFLAYVESGYYDGTIFHRVIPGFMVQGGGFTADMVRKTCGEPIKNEADKGLKNERGTIAMARTSEPHSASSQFFINTVDNDFLNHKGKNPKGWGYAVFGRALKGMDVVDAISKVKTGVHGRFRNIPLQPVVIQRAMILE